MRSWQQQLVAANKKLRRYMAPPLLETLREDRQTVTILFLDFCDFTAVTRNFPPDELVRMMNDYFALLAGAVLDNGGYLDKIMGDGLMSLYKMPVPQMNFTALGREVNLTKRVEEEAQPSLILLSAGTYRRVKPDALGLAPSQSASAGW